MAFLIDVAAGRRTVLLPQHVFGRDRACTTRLDVASASRLHASIRWTGERWELRDHSRNGTWLDGRRLAVSVAVPLALGQRLSFGGPDVPPWQVQDLQGPGPMLLPADGGDALPLARTNLLPEGGPQTVSIDQALDGRWRCTTESGCLDLLDGDELQFGGRRWRFLACESQVTHEAGVGAVMSAPACALRFQVSLDEEHVVLGLTMDERDIDLGERTHHYVLLTLARLRMDEAHAGREVSEQGWVEHARLARMLGLDPAHLNIQIFRLRQQIGQALGRGTPAPDVIQRRRGELRLGDVTVAVRRGAGPPASFDPAIGGEADRLAFVRPP